MGGKGLKAAKFGKSFHTLNFNSHLSLHDLLHVSYSRESSKKITWLTNLSSPQISYCCTAKQDIKLQINASRNIADFSHQLYITKT